MSSAADARGENLDRQEEGRGIWASVEEELCEGEEGHEAARGGGVRDASPDGVEDSDNDAADELLTNASNEVREEDAEIEAWEEALHDVN